MGQVLSSWYWFVPFWKKVLFSDKSSGLLWSQHEFSLKLKSMATHVVTVMQLSWHDVTVRYASLRMPNREFWSTNFIHCGVHTTRQFFTVLANKSNDRPTSRPVNEWFSNLHTDTDVYEACTENIRMTDSCDYYSAIGIVKFISFPVFVLLTINEGLTRNSALGKVMAYERGLSYHHITEQYRQLTVDSRTRKRRQHHRVVRQWCWLWEPLRFTF